jgi:glucokinase
MRLVADIGGTNARFALAGADGALSRMRTLPVAGYAAFAAALDAYLAAEGAGARIGEAAIAAAGPRAGGAITLTNASWRIEAAAVSARLGGVPVRLLNDLEAVALALPGLEPGAVVPLDGAGTAADAPGRDRLPRLAVNLGTGFGAAVAVPVARGGWTALATEAGHMTLLPASGEERALIAGAVTVEDVFSGPGLARLGGAAPGGGGDPPEGAVAPLPAAASAMLGRVLADLALATGAWGGVFLCGGVTASFGALFDAAAVARAFRRAGPMAARLAAVQLCLLRVADPAMRALAGVPVGPCGEEVRP